MTQHQVVRAIYHAGTLQLLEPVDLPDGVELQVTLPVVSARKTPAVEPAFPTRPADPDVLRQLCGLIAVGGDALVDSEVLDDTGGD
jgi:AF2212-like protein